jgi:hypothetical protein
MKRFWILLKRPSYLLKTIYLFLLFGLQKLRGKKLIVYNLHQDYFYDIFENIYLALKKEPHLIIYFAYLEQNRKLYQYLQKQVPSAQIISNLISPFLPFDLFICAEVTGPDFPLKIFSTPKIQIYHGTGTANLYAKKNVLNRFDIHFSIGPRFNDFIQFAYLDKVKQPKVFNVGYPKLDSLIDPNSSASRYQLPLKSTILFAPHWTHYSALLKFEEDLLNLLASFQANILIKPHNYLYTKYADQKWYERLQNFADQHDNVTFVTNPNTQELYPLADIMITDTGTTAALEYSILSKPLLINDDPQWFNDNDSVDMERDLCDLAFCFQDLSELKILLDKLLSDPQKLKLAQQQDRQKEIVEKHLYPPGQATNKAVAAILAELNLSAAKLSEQFLADN